MGRRIKVIVVAVQACGFDSRIIVYNDAWFTCLAQTGGNNGHHHVVTQTFVDNGSHDNGRIF